MDPELRMHAERTPNPDSMKWVLGRAVAPPGRSAHFDAPPELGVSPLAASLLGIDGVVGVLLASNFVTVTRRPDVAWRDLAEPIVAALKECLAGGAVALAADFAERADAAEGGVAERIRNVLDAEIRPAVAMDGGDVTFVRYRDGIVELSLVGACSGCPSAGATLEHGIEARLRERIPEVQGVVAV